MLTSSKPTDRLGCVVAKANSVIGWGGEAGFP